MTKKPFGTLPSGQQAHTYTICCGKLQAEISDFGAVIVRLYVPDDDGNLADVVLGFDDVSGYLATPSYFGGVVGRNANRICGAKFMLGDKEVLLTPNQKGNSLHSGPDSYAFRIWKVERWEKSSICFSLYSPHGDQGFPGSAHIHATYSLEPGGILRLTYEALSDKDTVFNLTNHACFNLAGHDKPELAMDQVLCMPARIFTPTDAASIPSGELRNVESTPFDFRIPKAIGRDIDSRDDTLKQKGGYDHNFEVFTDPCAILTDPVSGRTMAVSTDCPGLQLYAGNFMKGEIGKDGAVYCRRGGICLETQFYPDSVHHPEWAQPFCKAGQRYHSETKYIFR